jgi:hypothetical protein
MFYKNLQYFYKINHHSIRRIKMAKENYQLKGKDNKRINDCKPTDNEGTAAWANEETKQKHSEVSIPSLENVLSAKEWVDNGSKL